jgi:hypothetical protein
MQLQKYPYIPEDHQQHSPVLDTASWCLSLAMWENQPLRMHLSTGHAKTCLAAVIGASDMHPSASTQNHVAAEPKYTHVNIFISAFQRNIHKVYIILTVLAISTKDGEV